MPGIPLLGPVTRESLLAGLYDGLRLATIVICVGAANSLANPKRLLQSVPSALYEIGTALVVAVTVLPAVRRQPPPGARRPGAPRAAARAGWGGCAGSSCRCSRTRSSARWRSRPGWTPAATAGRPGWAAGGRFRTGGLLLLGLCGICVGTYAVLDLTAPRVLAVPMLPRGSGGAVTGLWSAGRRVERTRYRPDQWRAAELVVSASGIAVVVAMWRVAETQLLLAYPGVDVVPGVSALALVGVLVGLVPAVAAPPPTSSTPAEPPPPTTADTRTPVGAGGGR